MGPKSPQWQRVRPLLTKNPFLRRLPSRALDALMRNRTTIVIAHRLSTVRHADMLVVLEQGRVAETGDHAELVARNGLYARLIRRQLGAARERLRAVGN